MGLAGEEALLQSRVTDSTGYIQPSRAQLVEMRGTRSIYHNNAIQTWRVGADGEVHNVQLGLERHVVADRNDHYIVGGGVARGSGGLR
ncbi:MAG: hypothetical protein CM15mP74_03070 [Halieaceae bacterium]|nr:MAG: hypothetical protein CM15mP74_03070 [Halieaceae bacterium]